MIDPEIILAAVAEVFRVSIADIHSRRRFVRHMRARHAAAWLMVHAGYGVTETAELLGRHYTTISSSVDAADRIAKEDPTYAAKLRALSAAIDGAAPNEPAPPQLAPRGGSWIVAPALHLSMFWWGIQEPPVA